MIEPLVSNWMEVRVNLQFPVEYGIWQATPEYMRKRFGRELLIVGGYDKLALEKGRDAIAARPSNEGRWLRHHV